MLVFDDLHWADRPTLQLLRHLVRSPAPRRVLFLGTYRESEISDRHPLHELIGDLRREGTLRRLELTGLAEAEVGELVAELASAPATESFVHALAGETEGNPFFIEEVVRHIRDTAGALTRGGDARGGGRPGRRARGHRAAPAAPERAHARRAAGRVGDRARVRLRRPGGGRRRRRGDELVEALEEGVEARVLREAGHVGRYAFTHALVRATLYDSISQLRRARLHGRVGEALVRLRGGDLDPHLAMLAHHFAQAAPVERPDRAIDFALAAARRADRMLAWEEAAQHYRAALRARELAGAVDDHVRAELLLALGASEDRAGLEEEARETFQAAIRTARQLGDAVLLTRGGARRGGAVVGAVALGSGPRGAAGRGARGAARGGLAAARAAARADVARALLRGRAGAAAVAVRRGGRRSRAASATCGRWRPAWTRATTRCGCPENVEERLEVAAELRRVAEETGDPELELQGAGWTIIDLMELGDIDGVDIQIAAASKLAEALHRPIWLWWTSLFRGARAQLAGRLRRGRAAGPGDAGDRPARPGRERPALLRAGDVQHPPRAGPAGRGRGRRARLHRALPGDPGLARRAGAAADRARAPGRGARRVRAGRRGRLRRVPARRELADRDHADGRGLRRAGRRARAPASSTRLLEPYAGRNVVVGRNATCNGSASRLLGVLAAAARASGTLAERHFDEAQAMHAAMGARPLARAHAGLLRGAAAGAPRAGRRRRGRARCSPTRSSSPTRSGWSCWPSARGGSCPPAGRVDVRRGGESSDARAYRHRTMARATTVFVCSACAAETPRWMGQCPGCGEWNTLSEETRGGGGGRGGGAGARRGGQAAAAARGRGADATRG